MTQALPTVTCPKCQRNSLRSYDLGKPLVRYICEFSECGFSCLYNLPTSRWWTTNPNGVITGLEMNEMATAEEKVMDLQEALEAIETGHAIWSPAYAAKVCETFGVSFPKSLIQVFESERDPLGVTMYHGPDDGVWSLTLARHVAECLGVKDKARGFIGRGSQAQEYARVVAEKLGIKKEA